jgi:hypothetical protein
VSESKSDAIITLIFGVCCLIAGVLPLLVSDPTTIMPWVTPSRVAIIWNPIAGTILAIIGVYNLVKALRAFAAPRDEDADFIALCNDLLVVELPLVVSPIERGEKYEKQLDAYLRSQRIGYVSGGGTPLSADPGEGSSIELSLIDAAGNLHLIFEKLKDFGFPPGTKITHNDDADGPRTVLVLA